MLMRRISVMDPVSRNRPAPAMDRIFETVVSDLVGPTGTSILEAQLFPPINMWQDDQAVHVEAELPGFSMNDLEITLHENRLTLRGRRESVTSSGASYLRRERRAGEFSRAIPLPIEVDPDHVSAEFRNGVLHVTMPKAAAAQPRRIEIKSAS